MIVSYLIHIDPFSSDIEVVPPIISHSPSPIIDHNSCKANNNRSIDTSTLLLNAPNNSSSLMTSQAPYETIAPPPS